MSIVPHQKTPAQRAHAPDRLRLASLRCAAEARAVIREEAICKNS